MVQTDFDIDSLAAYLHLTPAQVSRMADRGKLPARKISGQWRFARAEIHHWLEDRIGASDEDQLIAVEEVLEREHAARGLTDEVRLLDLLPAEAIAVPLECRTRGSAIRGMVQLAARSGRLWDAAKMEEAVRDRENLHPTAIENGVALLHPRRPMASILAEPLLAFGRSEQGIPFGGAGGVLTDLFFLIASVDDRGHLRVLARLSRLLAHPDGVDALRAAPDAEAVHRVIETMEQELE